LKHQPAPIASGAQHQAAKADGGVKQAAEAEGE